MAVTVATTTNAQILEGLYGLGIDPALLKTISTKGTQASFKDRLLKAGIGNVPVQRAMRLVGWRPGEGTTLKNQVTALLGIFGTDDATRKRILAGDDATVMQAAQQYFPPQQFNNMLIKMGRGSEVAPENWNPFRGDVPQAGKPSPADWRKAEGFAGKPTPTSSAESPLDIAIKTASATGIPVLPPPLTLRAGASEQEFESFARANYGYMSWMLDVPELRKIVKQVAENPSGWTVDSVTGAVQATPWWTANGATTKAYLERRTNDPVGAKQLVAEKYLAARGMANKGDISIPEERLQQISEDAVRWGWTDQQMQATVGAEYRYDPSKPGATAVALKGAAKEWLVPLGDDAIGSWGKRILTGEVDETQFNDYLRNTASSMFPQFAEDFKNNKTVADIVEPYKQWAARTLEMSPEDIDFMDQKWMRMLNSPDEKTGVPRALSLTEMDKLIKRDPTYRYDYTKAANERAGTLGTQILQRFGQI